MKNFCKFLLFICLLGFSTAVVGFSGEPGDESQRATGVAHASPTEENPSSPRQDQAAPTFETPGERLSRHQAEVLRREAFEEVVGISTVEEWAIDWAALRTRAESPYSSAKRIAVSRLMDKMTKLMLRREDVSFDRLLQQVLLVRARMEAVHLERLEEVVKKHLLNQYSGAEVDFDIKEGGDQLGTVAFVKRPLEEPLKFYVKTHSEGKLASKSSAAKRVNPGELLIYKILEELGVGCEAHFCARSAQDVYIATLNAATGGRFFLFENAKKDEQGIGKTLWGEVLGALHTSPQKNDVVALENALATDLTGQHFVQQASTLELISRLGKVHDLLNNPQNFGFFKDFSMTFPIVRIIDFRIPEKRELPLEEGHFRSFLDGNGFFNYPAAHPTIRFALHDRLRHKRAETALWVLREGPLRDVEGAIERAFESVLRYFREEASAFGEGLDPLLSDLEFYRNTFHQNHRDLREKLESWRRDGQGPV